eukprot:TRINITY_DN3638_c0_g2_i4.p1 TRINITY_DN3638_c0_g2~~TRINITY_DN3638_c0_g2_i4.p1  ORF type:complete len:221 (-),score=40.48 TRINITY_DN3638_c0_g2_i4:358-1020(-)
MPHTAENLAMWTKREIIAHVGLSNLFKVVGLVTDTCATMKAMWDLLRADPLFSHVISVPCFAHIFQLTIKDILALHLNTTLTQQASNLVTSILNSPLKLSIFRDQQDVVYGKRIALQQATIVRWGSHLNMFDSLLRNRQALISFANASPHLDQPSATLIFSDLWWLQIQNLASVLSPITTALIRLEADSATVADVFEIWHVAREQCISVINGQRSHYHSL